MSYKEILKLIEEVDPSDENQLRLINAHVYAFLHLHDGFKVSVHPGGVHYRHKSWPEDAHTVLYHFFDSYNYTTSRDALKQIRPEGWEFQITNGPKKSVASAGCYNPEKQHQVLSAILPTEELAELHAIIQAIAYERENQ